MLTSLALIFLLGLLLGSIFVKLKLPSILGMILTGIILGPHALNLLRPAFLDISADLRQLALVIILTRAGLTLDMREFKRIGRAALLMCFVPASIEIVGVVLLAPPLMGVTYWEAALMGSTIAAVSPAVVVPRMLKMREENRGVKRGIPQMLLAGASLDDVYVLVTFAAFLALLKGESVSATSFLSVPVSITLGAAVGVACGYALVWFFKHKHMRDTVKVLIILSFAFLLNELEHDISDVVPFSGMIAVVAIAACIYGKHPELAKRISGKFTKFWVAAEIILFVLVGSTLDVAYAFTAGIGAIFVVLGAMFFRMAGVAICMWRTPLNYKERLFCMLAYVPKATVQAAIGGVPLSFGLACGNNVLTLAAVAIMVTAPLGAIFIDKTYRRLVPVDSADAENG
ncbi:sodium/proton antiporter, CPA1 family [Fibrobacter sp. UWB15]|uniref:cation:proton antiporter n=1 Tax=unclassified Fibrobacter TaxID=2634177 RepID=UPI000921609E|nr:MULTISPECIES: cation:proton antiporter [unclassified Fibrobacter]PWJ68020.1 sodium/proton antiporter (CPA1 family) [Fibrobacter sp. UWB6]SHF84655.1 sodium/proton antiporter, CPA1 family [Fibrobacter sp. UWB8]SMG17373.1 sodium/proton antiporter, CPA1 family [Fibrobacter sp. UWB15]